MSNSSPPTLAENICISNSNLVWVDCEMTGLDLKIDTLLEIAVIITDKNLNILAEGPNFVIHQPNEVKINTINVLGRSPHVSKLDWTGCLAGYEV
jgi:oligoribonuclease (3'-5' exoribonuclease)